ncbi:MAG TPA: ATP-binding protein [Myxococcota bacterium]|nr:ATP-binding protein [Myxococcota bacterium]
MTFIQHVEERYTRTMEVLGLPAGCARILHALVLLDLEGPDKGDVHGRQGIIPWNRMVDEIGGTEVGVADMEEAMVALADWGLAQIVGRGAADPKLTGAAALRLTHAGRACLGLAPHRGPSAEVRTPDKSWIILHHANREGLILGTRDLVGDLAWRPLIPGTDRNQLAMLCGQIATSIVTSGAAVVDGFGLGEAERTRDLPDLLWRTRTALAPRILLLPEPAPIRTMAVAVGARVRWLEPELETRRDDGNLDRRVTDVLMERAANQNELASACGVPRSSLARPKRVKVSLDDLLVPEGVRTQISQAIMHADFRLNILPRRSAFVGKGGGFRLLLSGLPGTGKSMMAEALATRLDRSVVKLDLSTVLSKWLGETEQMIGQVFDLAEASNSVLVLDEAEALFRQRNSGGSGGANALLTAVAYLLTRLDRFEGVLVATTNRTQDIDDALYRRFDDFIILPVPDHETRMMLWRRMLLQGLGDTEGFSDSDFEALGRHFVITGGLIRGAVIRAGAWAAGDDKPLSMPYVLASIARELEKSDHPTTGVLMQPYRARVAELLNDERYPGSI